MPARTVKIRHDDETRAKIQAGVIIDRFMRCLKGELELSRVQVSCGKTLLNKVLPDLASVSHSGDDDNPIKHIVEIRRVFVDKLGIQSGYRDEPDIQTPLLSRPI